MGDKAWVIDGARKGPVLEDIDLGPMGDEDVEVAVEHCGLCHSDLSIMNDDWGISSYPAVLGHEAIGRVTAVGPSAKGLRAGQTVGVGWYSASCMHCRQCLSGDQNLCATATATIIGGKGGFATRMRSHWAWAVPIPDGVPAAEAGPLLCGGITVFSPLAMFAKPTGRVGVVGIGGLGHLAVKFAAAYGCDVTAFTSSEAKFDEARSFGAHHVVSSGDAAAIRNLAGTIDLLIVTVNVPLDWEALIGALAPNGRMHFVGAVLDPVPVPVFGLLMKQAQVSASPGGPPVGIATMLDFAARHGIAPQNEHMPMSRIGDAFDRLAAGKARYRIVLDADF